MGGSMRQLLIEDGGGPLVCSSHIFRGKNLVITCLTSAFLLLLIIFIGVLSSGRNQVVYLTAESGAQNTTSGLFSCPNDTVTLPTTNSIPQVTTGTIRQDSVINPNVCQDSECVRMAARVLSSIDTSVNPCDDFYNFACGRYDSTLLYPDDIPEMDIFVELTLETRKKLEGFLSKPSTPKDEPYESMAKTYYRSCINMTQLQILDLEPLRNLLAKFGGWPVVEGQNWKVDHWEKRSAVFTETIVRPVFSIEIIDDVSYDKTLMMKPPDFALDKQYYTNDLARITYLETMKSIAVALGADETDASRDMQEVLNFESDLAKISDDDSYFDATSVTLAELKTSLPQVDVDLWLESAYGPVGKRFKDSDTIRLYINLQSLKTVLEKTTPRVITNYILMRVALEYYKYLHPDFHKTLKRLQEFLPPNTAPLLESRALTCYMEMKADMEWALRAIFVRRFFSKEIRQKAEQLVDDLRVTLGAHFFDTDWLDVSSKNNAFGKLEQMEKIIGYLDNTDNQTGVPGFNQGIVLNEDEWFENKLAMQKTNNKRSDQPVDIFWADLNPLVPNAYYSPMDNLIEVPAATLQYPFTSLVLPLYATLAGTGFTLGHEMVHGFSVSGSGFGDVSMPDWISGESWEEYDKRVNCLIDQYGAVVEPTTGLQIDGTKTIDDNIADNGGIKVAFKAFKKRGPLATESTLPGFGNYSQDQMFFLLYAMNWCEKIRPKALKKKVEVDVHSPPKYRVNIPLQNFDEFSKAFQCPVDSYMNPSKKCVLW